MTPRVGRFTDSCTGAPAVTLTVTVRRMWEAADCAAKRLVMSALSMVFLSSVLVALSPVILQRLLDRLNQGDATDVAPGVALLIILYASSRWFEKVTREIQELLLSRSDQRLNRRLSGQYFQHLISLPFSHHLERRTGALSQTLTNGLLGYRIILQHLVNSILPLAIEFVAMAAILILLGHAVFVAISALSLTFYIAAFRYGATVVSGPARSASLAHIDSAAVFADSVMNLEAIKHFRAEFRVARRFRAALRKTEGCWRDLLARKFGNGIVVGCIFGLTLGLSLFVAADNYYAGRMTVGEFVLVNTYVLQLVRPVEAAGFALRDIAQGRAFIDKMSELLEVKPESLPAPSTGGARIFDGDLSFENVSLAYDVGQPVLRGLSVVVKPRTTVGIVGRSGSGKSSIVRLLTRLLEPTDGIIRIGDKLLSDVSPAALRDAIGIVPQDLILFNDSIAFNIGFGKRQSSSEDIVAAAKIAGLHEFIVGLPNGYDTMVGERGLSLSGGERQRIAIARAAIRRAEIFIFDEATSSLDPETELAIVQSLAAISKNATTILITHQLGMVVHADEILVLKDGVLLEGGTHEALIARGGLYAAMWRTQHRDVPHVNGASVRLTG